MRITTTHLRRAATFRSAFTLIEIMIVVLIIGLLAMVAVPNVKRSLETSRYNTIIANLRTIDMVKTQWAAENKKGDADTPSEQDLAPYFNGGKFPVSVVGETYNLNTVGQSPTATTPVKLRDIQAGGTVAMPDK
jgi:prepilin-type N-terminal cleavage/methylation domain-containing protein